MKDVKATEDRLASAWYVLYPLDAYAIGPYRFKEPVCAETVVERAEEQFGEKPIELWPTGPVEEVDEYEFTLGDWVEEN